MNTLQKSPCLDSEQQASDLRKALNLSRDTAVELGRSALIAARAGYYTTRTGETVIWREAVQKACATRISIRPDAVLPTHETNDFSRTTVQVSNESTLQAAHRLVRRGLRPLALNFANGIHPGGDFLSGSRAQEEVLCRSSALYSTLAGDAMYEAHRRRPKPDSTDWAIYSPDVPVFRQDDGTELSKPWPLSILTCAAPYAPTIGQPNAADLLQQRIHRVLAIARAYGHSTLVLGAWGCGAFGNDPHRTARDFLQALENEYCGAFSEVIFAIADWSPERKFLGPFRAVFSEEETVFPEGNRTNTADCYQQAACNNWEPVLTLWQQLPKLAGLCSRYQDPASGLTFLHQAAFYGHEPACRELITLGAGIDIPSRDGRCAVEIASQRDHTALASLLEKASQGAHSLWKPSENPDILPGSSLFREARPRKATAALQVAYAGAVVRIPAGSKYYVDSFGRILIGWHGSYNPPYGMDGSRILPDHSTRYEESP